MLLTSHLTSWSVRAPLALPRAGYVSGLVHSEWIVAGGSYWTSDGKQRTAESDSYQIQCNCWHPVAPMPVPLSDASSVVIDNRLYVLGGATDAGASHAVYRFDGKEWKHLPAMQLPEARMNAAAVAIGTHIYLFGGIATAGDYSSGLRTAWSFDINHPQQGWVLLPECACRPRLSLGATTLHGKIYLFGGYLAEGANRTNLDDIWAYDPAKQVWSPAGKLPEGRRAFWAAADSDTIYLFGGYTNNFSDDVLAYCNHAVHLAGKLPEPVADAKFFLSHHHWYTTGGEVGIHLRGAHTWAGTVPAVCKETR